MHRTITAYSALGKIERTHLQNEICGGLEEISCVEIVGLNELQARWKLGQLPLLVRRGGCAIKKWSAASTSAQTGWLFKNLLQNNHPGASRHPPGQEGLLHFITQGAFRT